MGLQEYFYDTLKREYQEEKSYSFMCRYLKQERKNHPKEDTYTQLERGYAQWKSGRISQRAYLILALKVLSRSNRLGLGEMEFVLKYGRKLGGKDFFRGKRKTEAKYAALLSTLEAGEPAAAMDAEDVETLHRELRSAFLIRDAGTYLYDTKRKKSRDMAVLDAYCAEKNLTLAPAGGQGDLTPQEITQWETLFAALRRERRSQVLIPIRIDSRTGAGLFIMGRDYYPKALRNSLKEACWYGCFYLNEVTSVKKERDDTSLIFSASEEELEEMCRMPSLKEAKKWYFEMLHEDGGWFYGCNEEPPKGCPEPLLRYFEVEEDELEDMEDVTGAGKTSYEQDIQLDMI